MNSGHKADAAADAMELREAVAEYDRRALAAERHNRQRGVTPDPVNHPPHYTSHPSGVEVIQITEHMGFCLGNVVKYVLRCDEKGNPLEDLRKARWYLDREIARREAGK